MRSSVLALLVFLVSPSLSLLPSPARPAPPALFRSKLFQSAPPPSPPSAEASAPQPAKLQLSVCAGATCSSSCLSPLTSLASAWGSAVEVRSTPCLGACGKGPNVGVLKGSGKGVSLPGMTEPERLRRCFMKAAGEEGAERIGGEVDKFLAGEPARALAAQAALAKPAAPLKNPGCEAADVVARVLALSGRDVSERGYGRDKLLKLLRERCGPLGKGEADELGG